jgi:hypothetical protein
MNNDAAVGQPEATIERRKQVELLHPINHDNILYSRGVHELDESLANLFLTYKDPISRKPIAREFILAQAAIVRGTMKVAK